MMAGKRELNRTIEELGIRVDRLGGVEAIILDPTFEAVQQQTEAAARTIIEEAADDVLQNIPIIGDLTGDETEQTSGGEAQQDVLDLLPGLLEKLLDLSPTSGEIADEADASE